MLENIFYICLLVLLPIIPASILYTLLPAGETSVSGPFKGLNIQLKGAFAAYFLVLITCLTLVYNMMQHRTQVWTVEGYTGFKNAAISPTPTSIDIAQEPPTVHPDTNGYFRLMILRAPDPNNNLVFPQLSIKYSYMQNGTPREIAETIYLEKKGSFGAAKFYTIERDNTKRNLTIKEAIYLSVR